MKWKSNAERNAIYGLAMEEWDQQTLEFAEALGNWMESGQEYRDFFPEKHLNFALHPDQIGAGLVLFISEWAGDCEAFTQGLSGLECNLMAYYMQMQILHMSEIAATTEHRPGEADATLGEDDLDK